MTAQIQPTPLPLQFNQILDIVKQLGKAERQSLLLFLLGHKPEKEDLTLTHFASEPALAQDWLTETEDEAWQNL
ncbi:MAG: hypothetical protein KA138_06015 [Saprospiraceae bacterium]|nr:hypothetical protein [Saprospiraceae bacterium]